MTNYFFHDLRRVYGSKKNGKRQTMQPSGNSDVTTQRIGPGRSEASGNYTGRAASGRYFRRAHGGADALLDRC
jgi:hypothetical protein